MIGPLATGGGWGVTFASPTGLMGFCSPYWTKAGSGAAEEGTEILETVD